MLTKKDYPKVVVSRAWMKNGMLLMAAIIFGVIIFNMVIGFTQTTPEVKPKSGTPLQLASEADINWMQDAVSKAPKPQVASQVMNTPKTPAPILVNNTATANLPTATLNPTKATNTVDPLTPQNDGITQYADTDRMTNNTALSTTPMKSLGSVETDDQNKQQNKENYLKANVSDEENYLSSSVNKAKSPYEIKAGTLIPGVLMTGINSDLPGTLIGQVRENVYDSVSGNEVLIPQGTKIVGTYNAQMAYGQDRVQVIWNRLLFPDGTSLTLKSMIGVDSEGYSGFQDLTNNHYGKIFGAVLLSSVLGAGAQLSQPQQPFNSNGQLSVGQTIAQSVGSNIANTANSLTEKNINIQPTNEIRQGYKFDIIVNKDMSFTAPFNHLSSEHHD